MHVGRSLAFRAHGGRFAVLVLAACFTAALVGKLVETALADPASPITVTKSASSSSVSSGAQLTYTIVITNTGGAALKNLVLSDQINGLGVVQTPPALPQLTMTSTKGSCTQGGPNGNLVTCNGGAMAGGETWTVTIGGQVTAGSGTNLNNTASVTGTKSAQNFTTLSNSVSTPVSGGSGGTLPDLSINKTGPTSVAPSAPITYTLTVNNTGTANATGIRVVDTLPAGVALTSVVSSSLFVCLPNGATAPPVTVTCTGGAVNQGQNATITINGTAPGSPTTITNTAVVDPNNTIPETNELNNTSALVNTTVGGPPAAPLLAIKKTDGNPAPGAWGTGAGPDPVNPGQKLTYKILVTNNATGNNARADDVVVTDATQGLEAASIVASQTIVNGSLGTTGGCVVAAPQVRCSIKSLNSGGTLAITISGTVVQSAGSSIFNTATVTGNVKNQGVTNTASEVTTVRPQYDLTITKADQPDPVCARSWPQAADRNLGVLGLAGPPDFLSSAGGAPTPLVAPPVCLGGLRYDFVVGNSGIADAAGVVVRDPLPAGLILDSYASDAGFACSVDIANVVTCVNGSIPASSTKRIAFVLVAPPNVGSITNTVIVDPNNAIFEADETNNTATESTGVSTGIDLVVWKGDGGQNGVVDPPGGASPLTEGFDPIATNGTNTYTIIVDNVGTQNSTGIKVRDALPAGTKFLSATTDPTHGFTCAHDGSATGGNVTCVGGHVLGTASEFYDPPGVIPAGPGDDFATITIKVFVTPFVQPSMHNEVRVDPDNEIAEVNEQNNFAQDNTAVTVGNDDKGAFNQLTIAKTQTSPPGPASVATNGTLIYNLHVENKGTDPVSNVVVKDFLPAGTRFIEAKDTAAGSAAFFCTHDGAAFGGVVTCTGGDFSGSLNTIPGVPTSRDITVKVFAPNAPATINNLATVDPDNFVPEGNEFDNDSHISTTVTVGGNNMFNELNLTKTQTSPVGNVATSSVVEYELVVKNDGSDPAFQVVVRDTLPAGFNFISADDEAAGANAFQCTNAANVITCTSARLDPGAGAARKIKVKAFSATQPGNYTNQAVVDPNNTIPEGDETNNTAQATTKVVVGAGFVDLKVQKGGPATATPGSTITYQLTVQNLGTDPAFNVKVRDDLPAHTTFVSAVDTTTADGLFSCALVGGSILCTGGTLDGSGDLIPAPDDVPDTRIIEVKVLAPTNITPFATSLGDIKLDIFNRAIVDPDNTVPESNETNNASQLVKTTVRSAIDLTLDKQGPGSATQNQTTTYTITVKNEIKDGGAGQTAHGVKVVDPLPTGLIPLNIEASVDGNAGNFTCQLQENPVNFVTCIGDLEAGKTLTVTISAFVTLESGTLDNEACVDPDDTVAETSELNNCKHAIGEVIPAAPDIQINKKADKSSVTANEKLDYTLSVSNVGTADTDGSDVVVTDNVPSDVTVDQVVEPNGWDCSATVANNVSCKTSSMAQGDSADIVIKTTAASSLTAPFTNTATVSGGGDSQTNNNESDVKVLVGAAAAVDLEVVSLTDTPDPVNHDNLLTYTGIVVNNGTSGTGPGAIIRVVLPASGVHGMSVAASNTFSCGVNLPVDGTGHTFDCIGDFGATGTPTGSTEVTATMTVDSGAPPPAQLSTTVTADPALAIAESDETNNEKTETTAVSGTVCGGSPCVDLFASATGTPIVGPGGVAAYFTTIMNVGTNPVPDVAWTVQLEFIGVGIVGPVAAPAGVTCTPLGLIVQCTSDAGDPDAMDLAPGASVVFPVTVSGILPPSGSALFKATADSTDTIAELTNANNVALVPTVITP